MRISLYSFAAHESKTILRNLITRCTSGMHPYVKEKERVLVVKSTSGLQVLPRSSSDATKAHEPLCLQRGNRQHLVHFFANPEGIRIFKKYGHRAPLMCDSTCRMCINYVHIFTIMVIGNHSQRIPVAHFITEKEDDVAVTEGLALQRWLAPEVEPSFIMTVLAESECRAFQLVFPSVPIQCCWFHLKQPWLRWLAHNNGLSKYEEECAYKECIALMNAEREEEVNTLWEQV